LAFLDGESELSRLESQFQASCGHPLLRILVSEAELPLVDAVRSYFFNSQIVKPHRERASHAADLPRYVLVCPHHCQEIPAAGKLIARLVADPQVPIDEVRFVRLAESMANGGGPACLRLRMILDDAGMSHLESKFRLTEGLFERLSEAIESEYPPSLTASDLCDVEFVSQLSRIDAALRAAVF